MTKPLAFYSDLSKSPFVFFTNGVTYYFSSDRKRSKFIGLYNQNRIEIAARLHKRYRFSIDCTQLADLYLYKEIENRGFYVEIDGGAYKWPEKVRFCLEPLTKPNSDELSAVST